MLETIGKYQIIEKIGRGAMGEVYRAHDPVLNRDVAIKTISTDMAPDASLRKRFEREAQSAAQLSHPNIITVYEFGQEQDVLFMAMELLQGQDLKHAIRQRVIRTTEQKLVAMEQTADALALAHAQDIVHRDLKPGNIHVQPNGQIKVMDFGLARLSGSEMTRTGMVMGTPNYMAPEQVRGEKADTRSDVFSLGCCFYELLCGRKPFDADSMHAVLFKVMQEAPVPLREKVRDAPVVLVQVVEKCLAKDPALRFQNAGELREGLREVRQAIEAGQGFHPLAGLELPAPETLGVPAGAESSGAGSVAAVVSSGFSASASASIAPPPASRAPIWIAALVILVALAGAAVVVVRQMSTVPQLATTQPAELDALTGHLVRTQVELAQKRLAAGDYREALAQAERALRLDPKDEAGQSIRAEAKAIADRVDAALARAQAADENGDTASRSDALWELLQADPEHALAAQLTSQHEASFRGHADEARVAAETARKAAEAGGTQSLPRFKRATSLISDAEADLSAKRYATATLRLMTARQLLERVTQK